MNGQIRNPKSEMRTRNVSDASRRAPWRGAVHPGASCCPTADLYDQSHCFRVSRQLVFRTWVTPYDRGAMVRTDGKDEARERRVWTALRIALVASVLLAYAPVFTADFTVWDDWFNVVQNPRLNPPTWSGVGFYWRHSAFDLYVPATYTLWAGLAKVAYVNEPDAWGSHLNSYVFHAANVLLHAASALMVLEILRKVLRAAQPRGNAPAGSVLFAAGAGAVV